MENYRQKRIDYNCEKIEALREKFPNLPTAEMVREAIDGILHFRTGRMLANAPKFTKRPLANIFYRVVEWHRGNGNLGPVFSAKWDCELIVRDRGLDITANELHDQLDTLALLLWNGKSNATAQWSKALGR